MFKQKDARRANLLSGRSCTLLHIEQQNQVVSSPSTYNHITDASLWFENIEQVNGILMELLIDKSML